MLHIEDLVLKQGGRGAPFPAPWGRGLGFVTSFLPCPTALLSCCCSSRWPPRICALPLSFFKSTITRFCWHKPLFNSKSACVTTLSYMELEICRKDNHSSGISFSLFDISPSLYMTESLQRASWGIHPVEFSCHNRFLHGRHTSAGFDTAQAHSKQSAILRHDLQSTSFNCILWGKVLKVRFDKLPNKEAPGFDIP